MRNNIKYSVPSLIIILSFMFVFVVSAEEIKVSGSNSASGEVRINVLENKDKRGEVKAEVKNAIKTTREENKAKLEAMIQSVKEKRAEFRSQMEVKKEEAKTKMAVVKTTFKENLTKIKDEKKKVSAEKILENITALNIRLTTEFSAKINQIENVLISVESRISKAESNGLNVTSTKTAIEKAKKAIEDARASVSTQSSKVYETKVTSEATLKAEMQKLRNTFNNDIKAVRDQVKKAHEAVRIVATTLAKIPKIDEEVKVNTEVEVSSTTTNQ